MIDKKKVTIAFGCDHAGFSAKKEIFDYLNNTGQYTVMDFGTNSSDSVDYPDFVHPVAKAVKEGIAEWGILCCGTGNGVAMTANKYAEIRAAVCWRPELAALARQHNNANIICLPIRFIESGEAAKMVSAFSENVFEGGRHARRVHKMTSC